jgi:hypothetical protein
MQDGVRVYRPSEHEPEIIDALHEILQDARKVLELAMPDTFLGRKTQEPFPKEDDR